MCENCQNCEDCNETPIQVLPPKNTAPPCPQPNPCARKYDSKCVMYIDDSDISCTFEEQVTTLAENGDSVQEVFENIVGYFCGKINTLRERIAENLVTQLVISTGEDFKTSDTIELGEIAYSQNGRIILINNGNTDITVTCDTNIAASYQVLGTGTVTFVSDSGRTLVSPNGDQITSQYGTAALTTFGTTDVILVNNV